MTRREAITYISAPLLSSFFPSLRVHAASSSKPKTIIWVWPDGGPSQLEMFDPKPLAPASIRGPFKALNASGLDIQVGELFPHLAKVVQHTSVLRARQSLSLGHTSAMAAALGRQPNTGKHTGTKLASLAGAMPFIYAETPGVISSGDYRHNSFSVQFALEIHWDKQQDKFIVPTFGEPSSRLNDRHSLLSKLDNKLYLNCPRTDEYKNTIDKAFSLITRGLSVKLGHNLIQRYGGSNPTSLGILTVRELAKQNLSGMLLFRDGSWDFHKNLKDRMVLRAPQFDTAVAELIKDVHSGMLPNTVVVLASEFGRSPFYDDDGRGHFNYHTSLLCGSGIRSGVVYGKTDNRGVGCEGIVNDATLTKLVEESASAKPSAAIRSDLPPIFKS